MTPVLTGFLACFASGDHARAVIETLNRLDVSAHVLMPVDGSDDQIESRRGVAGIFSGASTGAVVGLGVAALAGILMPGPGTVVLAGMLASFAGFGSAGAVVGGLLGALSADEAVEQTVQFVHDNIAAGKTVIVVETTDRRHELAVNACRTAGGEIRELNSAESARFEDRNALPAVSV